MLRIATRLVGVLLVGQVSAAVPPEVKQRPGLSQRPVVAMPACSAPKPYHAERWTATSNRFYILLASMIGREDSYREARRLAERHKFEIDGGLGLETRGGYFFAVSWLEPAQVAALRCETSVDAIDVVEEVQVTSGGRY
jgi:hypothetical protein